METEEVERPRRRWPRRFAWAALAVAIVFGGAYLAGTFGWRLPEVKVPEFEGPFRGFYRGHVAPDSTLWFIFYQHPQWGLQPLLNYRTLHSNTIKLAVFAPGKGEVAVEIRSWLEEETGNGTRVWDERVATERLRPGADFDMIELELPTSHELRQVSLVYGGDVIWRGSHQTKRAYLPAPRYTLGSLAVDRMGYIVGAAFVCFAAIGVAKWAMDRVKTVPKISSWIVLIVMETAIMIAAASAWWYIYNVALINVAWTYAPIFLSAFLFGVYILRGAPDTWFFLRFHDVADLPQVEIWVTDVVWDGEQAILADIGWRDFLRGRRKRVMVKAHERQPVWWFRSPTVDGTRLYYVDDVREDRWGIHAQLAGIHQKKIEEYKAGLVAEGATAKALADATLKLYRVEADAKKKAIEEGSKMALLYISKLLVALGLVAEEEARKRLVERGVIPRESEKEKPRRQA